MLQTKDVELLLIHAALQVQYQKPEQAITLLDALLEICLLYTSDAADDC